MIFEEHFFEYYFYRTLNKLSHVLNILLIGRAAHLKPSPEVSSYLVLGVVVPGLGTQSRDLSLETVSAGGVLCQLAGNTVYYSNDISWKLLGS